MSVALSRCCFFVFFCLVVHGCGLSRSSPPVHSVPAHFARATTATVFSRADTHQVDLTAVQSQPLYRKAELACQQRNYVGAAGLLQHLAASPDLSAEQQRFVLEQRNLCLKDAGLPTPLNSPASGGRNSSSSIHSPLAGGRGVERTLRPEEADCGPRALLVICQQLGINTTLQHLRELAGTTGRGTSLAGLARAAQTLGLKTEGVQVSREALPEMQTPAIAWVDGRHFDAVLALHGSGEQGTATLQDPNQPHEEEISQERLLRLSSGYLLLVHR